MFSWRTTAHTLLDAGEIFCLVHIEKTDGSTPRDVDTVMLVTAANEYGTIGGGNLEFAAIDAARNCLVGKSADHQTLDYILGPDVEQCCGGRVVLSLQNILASNDLPQINTPHHTPLYLFGAGHVGTALMQALAPLPFDIRCYDNRPEKNLGEVRLLSDPKHTILSAPKNVCFLIMTHDHKLDYQLVKSALIHGCFNYLGLIGSKTKRARFKSRLKKDGFGETQLARLTCPIGVESIQGKQPEIIAASVVAQLLQITGR